ncbi:hypothetical protein [Mycobacterium sp. E3247]
MNYDGRRANAEQTATDAVL